MVAIYIVRTYTENIFDLDIIPDKTVRGRHSSINLSDSWITSIV